MDPARPRTALTGYERGEMGRRSAAATRQCVAFSQKQFDEGAWQRASVARRNEPRAPSAGLGDVRG